MKLIKWFRDGTYLEHATLVTFTVFVFCCGIGLGLFLGLDSQDAQVKKLEAENAVLAQTLTYGAVTIGILQVKVQLLTDMVRKFMEEEDKSKDYNDTALD